MDVKYYLPSNPLDLSFSIKFIRYYIIIHYIYEKDHPRSDKVGVEIEDNV